MKRFFCFSDSKTLVSTVDKNTTKNEAFPSLSPKIKELLPDFSLLIPKWLPENKNKGQITSHDKPYKTIKRKIGLFEEKTLKSLFSILSLIQKIIVIKSDFQMIISIFFFYLNT